MSEWSVCPACKHKIHLGDDFCAGCGRKILYSPKQQARARQIELEKTLQKQVERKITQRVAYNLCIRCGAHNPPAAVRCTDCGHSGLIKPTVGAVE